MRLRVSESVGRILAVFAILLVLFGVLAPHILSDDAADSSLPLTSFVQIETAYTMDVTGCDENVDTGTDCSPRSYEEIDGAASGFVVNPGQVITAGHVCFDHLSSQFQAGMFEMMNLNNAGQLKGKVSAIMRAVDHSGEKHSVEIVTMGAITDVCLLNVEGLTLPPVKMADKLPERGERVYNIAAPRGVFYPGMALVFDGFYSGLDTDGDAWFTIPTAEGSSGSPIFNSDNELVAMTFGAHKEFESTAIAVDVLRLKNFMTTALSDESVEDTDQSTD